MAATIEKPARKPVASRLRRLAVRMLQTLVFIYFALFAFLAVKQTYFIFPGGRSHDPAWFRVTPGKGCRLVNRGNQVLGIFEPALRPDGTVYADIDARPTLLYCYGNGSCMIGSIAEMDRFRRAGVNVFIPEYPAYGMNTGTPSERGCCAAAAAAFDYLTHDLHIAPERIVIAGWSLGSAIAIDLASRVRVAGLVVISPFTNMAEEAGYRYPMYPPWLIRLVLRSPFENDRKIGRVSCPILDIHSVTDEVVPFDMSRRLLAHARTPVTRLIIERARHHEFFTVGGDRVVSQLLGFIETSTHAGPNRPA